MFEYHGWTVIRSNSLLEDERDEDEAELFKNLKTKLESMSDLRKTFSCSQMNGMLTMLVSGLCNHRRSKIIEVFHWLAEQSNSSYGLLYIHDDEDHERGEDCENVFRVHTLVRGNLIESGDPFLSPVIPTIEDPFNFENQSG